MSRVETGRGEPCKADAAVVRGARYSRDQAAEKGAGGLAAGGVTLLFRPTLSPDFIVGAMGLYGSRIEVIAGRLPSEYAPDVHLERAPKPKSGGWSPAAPTWKLQKPLRHRRRYRNKPVFLRQVGGGNRVCDGALSEGAV